uniref:Uncharacterized protein n=1 Tax=Biomphalaria glabrata TaxID=6526 RepID=A0A2C9L9D3_BIOGL
MKNNCDDVTCERPGSCLEMELLQIDHQAQIYDLLELNTSSLIQESGTQLGNSDLFNASSSPQNSANFPSLETQVQTQATDIWTTHSKRCTDPALQNSSVTGGDSHVIGDVGFPLQSYKASSDWQGGTFIPPATCSEESVVNKI